MLNPLKRRIMNIVVRAKVKAVDASKKLPKLRVSMLSGEEATGIEYFQQYGFASRPKAGGEAIIFFIGGNRDHGIALAVEEREKRLEGLAEGEAALYHPETGSYVKVENGGSIESYSANADSYVRQLANGTIEIENSIGVVRLKANGDFEFDGSKVSFKSGSEDLVALLSDLLTALTGVTVNTAVGPQPFNNLSEFLALQTKFAAFKE